MKEEDCEDLPIITIKSTNEPSWFEMPPAEELAKQRARELECKLELERLRRPAPLLHCDSSGSEPDLAAAVTALSVQPAPAAAPPAAALCAALRLPPPAADLRRAVDTVAAALAGERGVWPDEEVHCAGALLCVAVLAQESRSRRPAARALHGLLDDRATPAQVSSFSGRVVEAFPGARTRLQLSDAMRSGAGAGADCAAATLASAALRRLLGARPPLSAEDCYTGLQLAGRLLAHEPRATLLAKQMQILVAAYKLRLLFPSEP